MLPVVVDEVLKVAFYLHALSKGFAMAEAAGLEHELSVLGRIRHENVIRVNAVTVAESERGGHAITYLELPYAEHGNLVDWLDRGSGSGGGSDADHSHGGAVGVGARSSKPQWQLRDVMRQALCGLVSCQN